MAPRHHLSLVRTLIRKLALSNTHTHLSSPAHCTIKGSNTGTGTGRHLARGQQGMRVPLNARRWA